MCNTKVSISPTAMTSQHLTCQNSHSMELLGVLSKAFSDFFELLGAQGLLRRLLTLAKCREEGEGKQGS